MTSRLVAIAALFLLLPALGVLGAPTDLVRWCETFDSDVFEEEPLLGDPRWTRDDGEGITSGDGVLVIPGLGALSSRTHANVTGPQAFSLTTTQRLVSGGQNYLLGSTFLTFENGSLEVTYLTVDGNPNWGGWHFDAWTFIEEGAPAGEGSWMDIRVRNVLGEATLYARPTGADAWTEVTTASTDGYGRLVEVGFAQPWNAHIEVRSVHLQHWTPGFLLDGALACE